jgi:hypothetical protein
MQQNQKLYGLQSCPAMLFRTCWHCFSLFTHKNIMKKILGIASILFFGFAFSGNAQVVQKTETTVKTGAKKAWHGTKKGANTVAQKTKKVYSKTKATITDKKSDQWIGPAGQDIYVNDNGKYYWINGSGKRIYVSQSALKAKQ